MKVLFLTPQLPHPPTKGTALRNFHLMANLASGHEVYLLSFVEESARHRQAEAVSEMEAYCRRVVTVPVPPHPMGRRLRHLLLSSLPDMALRLRSAQFASALGRLLEQEGFDIVQVEGIEMAPYIPLIASLLGRRPRIVFDEHNAEYLLQRRAFEIALRRPGAWAGAAYSFLQWLKLRRYEREACRAADHVLVVSEADRQGLLALAPGLPTTVVPNGVDTSSFSFPRRCPPGAELVFTGTMDFRPNVDAMTWFCTQILPRIRREVPQAHLSIVGRSPSPAVRALAGASIVVTGEVDDIRPYLAAASVYVVPLRFGGGTRFKVLEALAAGVFTVSTRFGTEGIAVAHQRELLLADDANTFAHEVVRLLREPELGDRLAQAGRTLVERDFDWRVIVPRLERVYQSLGLC